MSERLATRRVRLVHLALALGLLWGALLLVPDAAAYEHRRGTPSFGAQVQFGMTAGDSEWKDLFDRGFGVVISVRQYIKRDRAVGLTGQQQSFDRIGGNTNVISTGTDRGSYDRLQFQLLMLDYYAYFRRMAKRTPYIVVSGGFYHPQYVDEGRDVQGTPGEQVGFIDKDGFVLRAGGGLEYFVRRTLSIDSTLSGYFLSAPGVPGTVFTVQLGLGFHLYTR